MKNLVLLFAFLLSFSACFVSASFAMVPTPEELDRKIIFKEKIDNPVVKDIKLKDIFNFHQADNVKIWMSNFMDGESYYLIVDFKEPGVSRVSRISYEFDSLTFEGKKAYRLESAQYNENPLGIYEIYTPLHEYLDSVGLGLLSAPRKNTLDPAFMAFFDSFQKDVKENNKAALAGKIHQSYNSKDETEFFVKYYNPDMPVFGIERKLFLEPKANDFRHYTAEVYGMEDVPKDLNLYVYSNSERSLIFAKFGGKYLFYASFLNL